MPVIYEDSLFIVRQSWFGPWRVVDKQTGATIAPETRLQEQVGRVWFILRKRRNTVPVLQRWSEKVLMQTFAIAAISPLLPVAQAFANADPEILADDITYEAAERIELLELWNT